MNTKRKRAPKPKRRKLVFGKDYHGWMIRETDSVSATVYLCPDQPWGHSIYTRVKIVEVKE